MTVIKLTKTNILFHTRTIFSEELQPRGRSLHPGDITHTTANGKNHIFSFSVTTTSTVWGRICFVMEELTALGHTVFLQVWPFYKIQDSKSTSTHETLNCSSYLQNNHIYCKMWKCVEEFLSRPKASHNQKIPPTRKPSFFPKESKLFPPLKSNIFWAMSGKFL